MAALAGVGLAFQAVGSLYSGRQAKKQAGRDAAFAEENARLARQKAKAEASRIRDQGRRFIGAQRAQIGVSGIGIENFADVISDSAAQIEADALMAEWGGELEARGFTHEAESARAYGKSAQINSLFSAASSTLQGIGTYAMMKRT